MKQPKQASTSSLRLDRQRRRIEEKGTLLASGAFRPIHERASRSAVHHEQVATPHLLPPHQSTLSLLRRLWPRQLIRSIRSSPEAVVHITGSCSSLALLILLRRQPLDRGSSIHCPSRLYANLLLSGVTKLVSLSACLS
jgi:hypothetical protein